MYFSIKTVYYIRTFRNFQLVTSRYVYFPGGIYYRPYYYFGRNLQSPYMFYPLYIYKERRNNFVWVVIKTSLKMHAENYNKKPVSIV